MEYIATCNCFSISRDAPPKLIYILLQASSSEQCHFMIKCVDTYCAYVKGTDNTIILQEV